MIKKVDSKDMRAIEILADINLKCKWRIIYLDTKNISRELLLFKKTR